MVECECTPFVAQRRHQGTVCRLVSASGRFQLEEVVYKYCYCDRVLCLCRWLYMNACVCVCVRVFACVCSCTCSVDGVPLITQHVALRKYLPS